MDIKLFFARRYGYLFYYLFYSLAVVLLILRFFKREWIVPEFLYVFFFVGGLYLGARIAYWSMRYLRSH